MSDEGSPEDLEQNLGESNSMMRNFREFVDPHREDAQMEDTRMVGISRFPGIDLGRAIILDREVSDTETIIRVKLDEDINSYNSQERRTASPLMVDNIAFAQDRRMSSPLMVDNNTRPTYRTLERRNSSPPRLETTRTSQENVNPQRSDTTRTNYVNVDPQRTENTRVSYVNVDPPGPDPTRINYGSVGPSRSDTTRISYVNVDLSRLDNSGSSCVNVDSPRHDTTRVSYVDPPRPDTTQNTYATLDRRSSSPPMVDYPGRGYCTPCRRLSNLPTVLNSRPSFVDVRRNISPPNVESARPSLSVFRFKQSAANAASSLPPRSPSPGRRGTAGDVSASVLKPTYNSARRSTYVGNVSPEKSRGSIAFQFPGRRTSTGDIAPSALQPKYNSRRRTTTGDINDGKRHSSPLRGRDGKDRLSRTLIPGPLGAVVLSWTNMTVRSRDGRFLLDDLSGQVHTGFTAIMGPSGSGKTTLLNTLACRMDKSATVHGKIRLNGKEYTNADLKRMSGYVMQDDLLNAHLTVDETLWYTVKLKLEPTFTEADLAERVNVVVKQMGLEHCRSTVIGSALRKGISGGERKRVAVGMELLTSPQLLFLDEPTSAPEFNTRSTFVHQDPSLEIPAIHFVQQPAHCRLPSDWTV